MPFFQYKISKICRFFKVKTAVFAAFSKKAPEKVTSSSTGVYQSPRSPWNGGFQPPPRAAKGNLPRK